MSASDTAKRELMEAAAADVLLGWRRDPVQFVRDNFTDNDGDPVEPDAWQADAMHKLKTQRRVVMSACKGPGKSCALAWMGWWILFCHKNAQGFALSITEKNLKDNLWKELAFWYSRSPVLKATFIVRKTRIESREEPDTWFLSARSFAQDADPDQQANSLAGLHGPTPFVLLDEVGDYPLGVIGAADGHFMTEGQNPFAAAAGNPTNRRRALFHMVTKLANKWAVVKITGDPEDPMRSSRVSITEAQTLIDDLGRDHPWVKINVLGEFPDSDADQLVDSVHIDKAMKRDVQVEVWKPAPNIWGLDPGRSPVGDESALARRRGVMVWRFMAWRGLDGVALAQRIATMIQKSEDEGDHVDALFCDVGGIGASAYDHLIFLGYVRIVRPIDFGQAADDPTRFADKRAEMWWEMSQWVGRGPACLPTDATLQGELESPMHWYDVRQRHTVLILESKDSMKSRGIRSPNRADALALTFAAPVARVSPHADPGNQARATVRSAYHPLQHTVQSVGSPRVRGSNYDPLIQR